MENKTYTLLNINVSEMCDCPEKLQSKIWKLKEGRMNYSFNVNFYGGNLLVQFFTGTLT